MPTNRNAPSTEAIADRLGGAITVDVFEVPRDFADGAGSYWARPEKYCDPLIRSGLSMFALLDANIVERAVQRLRSDLDSGAWDMKHGHLRTLEALDIGYRVVRSVTE